MCIIRTDSRRPMNRQRIATSPWRLNSTCPDRSTLAMAMSLLEKVVSRVTSWTRPSENLALTASLCPTAGALRTRRSGVTVSLASDTGFRSSRSPSDCHVRIRLARWLRGANRRPPTCGTCESALFRTRLLSGFNVLVRRPSPSCVNCWKSNSGSKPHRLRRNPSLPLGAP